MVGPLADATWRLIPAESRSGATTMALDDVAAETVQAGGPWTARVYRWRPPTLSLGYGQDPGTVDWAACERLGYDVVRRRTGGGAILHDGDVSYSLIVPADAVAGDVLDAYHTLLEPILDAFERLGVDAGFPEESAGGVHTPACYLRERHPAHDIVADGRKVCGNAQHRTKEAVVQHGSLSVTPDAEARAAVFVDDAASQSAFRSHAVGLSEFGVSGEDVADALEGALASWTDAEQGDWTDDELARAEAVAATYSSADWTRHRTE